VFVKDIEHALLAGETDMAVHSLKDMPAETPPDLTIAAVLPRADVRDALVGHRGASLAALPTGARIGTDSRRRAVQLLALRPDVEPVSVRGNVDTRVRKAESGELDAVVLAVAGLDRLGLLQHASQVFSIDEMLPAVGQGVLALEARADDAELLGLLARIDDAPTRIAITAERAFLRRLGAGCRLPVGAYGSVEGDRLTLRGLLADDDGRIRRDALSGAPSDAEALGQELAGRLLSQAGVEAYR
jgi:hydroxymethylbilane synthase